MALRSRTDRIVDVFMHFALGFFCLSIFYPFFYLFMNSVNARLDFGPAFFIPREFTGINYKSVFRDSTLINAFIITVLRTGAGVVVTVFNCAMCAFALRKRDVVFRYVYIAIFTVPMFFSGGLIPMYLNYRMLHILNTFFVYLIPYMFNFFYVIILMTCFNDVPISLEESATMDGANFFTVFIRIYFPVSIPVIATIALFAGVMQWNAWFDTMYFTTSSKLQTLSAVLMRIVRENVMPEILDQLNKEAERQRVNPEGVKFATMFVAIVPITLIYPFLRRYFIKGIMLGSIKG